MKTGLRTIDFIVLALVMILVSTSTANYFIINRIEDNHKKDMESIKEELYDSRVSAAEGFILSSAMLQTLFENPYEQYVHKSGIDKILGNLPKDVKEEATEKVLSYYSVE